MKIGTTLTEPVRIKRGVRQDSVLSPSLFNVYTDHIFREIEAEGDKIIPGIIVGGHIINNLIIIIIIMKIISIPPTPMKYTAQGGLHFKTSLMMT